MKVKYLFITAALLFFVVILGACSNAVDHSSTDHNQDIEQGIDAKEVDGKIVYEIDIAESHWMLNDELMFDAWTYNGTMPGQEIRVNVGDEVVMKFTNSLDVPTAVHLHGFPIPNEMDGVPGVTQNAIMPGEEFVYEYTATIPGTYWYHSHQKGSTQVVDRGLFGLFIVEDENQSQYDIDQVIAISEWSTMMGNMDGMDHGNMNHGNMHSGMNHGNMNHGSHGGTDHENMDHSNHGGMNHTNMDHGNMHDGMELGMSHAEMMNMMYDTFLINGKAAPVIETMVVKEGEKVKLRFLNAGLFTQVVNIPGHEFKITHYDGQEVNEPQALTDTAFRIAPGERYEVEIEMNNPGSWGMGIFAEENNNLQGLVPVVYEGFEGEELVTATDNFNYFDFTTYGQSKDIDLGEVTKDFMMLLGSEDGDETFTINGKQFPDMEVYEIEEGDVVKFTITNDTGVDHPMHLHGEFFYVISKDGQAVSGSPILKDTLNVRPDETYEIVFQAKNPGHWLFHCHEFHHAGSGMIAAVNYIGYEPKFELDPNIPNHPE